MNGWIRDFKISFRSLWKQPSYSMVAVAALALGIGGVTALFSVVHTVLLKPLPYADPDRLYYMRQTIPGVGSSLPFPPYLFEKLRAAARGVESIEAYNRFAFNVRGKQTPERLSAAQVSKDFFHLFGIRPILGRAFTREEESFGDNRVAVISYGFWQRQFGGSADALGRELDMDATYSYGPERRVPDRYTVVGVLPADFRPPYGDIDVWIPLAPSGEGRDWTYPSLFLYARLSPHLPAEQALSALNASYQSLSYEDDLPKEDRSLNLVSLPELQVQNIRPALLMLWAASGLVLLIACANVANLLLARAARRENELALRVVVGAGRRHLVRYVLAEVFLLAVLGTLVGLALAFSGIRLLQAYGPDTIPLLDEIGINPAVFLFTWAIAVSTSLLFGLIPALRVSCPRLDCVLRDAGRGSSAGRSRLRLRSILVAGETALALLLLISSSLTLESLFRLQLVDPGYRPENTLTMRVQLPASRYPERSQRGAVIRSLINRYRSVPGVVSVGVTNSLPLSNLHVVMVYSVVGREDKERRRASMRFVSEDYLEAMGVPLLSGRFFEEQDLEGPPRVVLINQKLATEHWPNGNPIGEYIVDDTRSDPRPLEIVGVVGNVHQRGLANEVPPALYIPLLPSSSASFVVRSFSDPLSSVSVLRQETAAVDARLPVFDVTTLEETLEHSLSGGRFQSMLMTVFAGVALALAVIGVFGVMSYSVSSRRHEIGIRMALGASRAAVVGMVFRQAGTLALMGTAVGLLAAYFLTRFLSSMLFGISARDPSIFASAALVLIVVALVASWMPARHAASVEPQSALRSP
jgi:putative ABC transport system permease protein